MEFKFGTELDRAVIEKHKDTPLHFRKGVPFAAGFSFPLLRQTLKADVKKNKEMKFHWDYLYAVEEEENENG